MPKSTIETALKTEVCPQFHVIIIDHSPQGSMFGKPPEIPQMIRGKSRNMVDIPTQRPLGFLSS